MCLACCSLVLIVDLFVAGCVVLMLWRVLRFDLCWWFTLIALLVWLCIVDWLVRFLLFDAIFVMVGVIVVGLLIVLMITFLNL